MKPVTELSDDELTEVVASECCGFYRRTPDGTAWHHKGELVFTGKEWRPLDRWDQAIMVKDAAEYIIGNDMFAFGKVGRTGDEYCCFLLSSDEPTFTDNNPRRAVLLACLSAVRAKKASVQS